MYFNEKNESTNIDRQFKKKRSLSFNSMNKLFIIGGIILGLFLIILVIVLLFRNTTRYKITLYGDTEISIYQGTLYNEQGYSATDNKNNNLNSEVKVESNLDNNTLGTYTITYSLNKVSIKRTINVIERPEIITVIHLIGSKNIKVPVGGTYTEPGCKAIDNLDGDISNKIRVSGSVDTNTKGIYRLIYSVVNSSNVTTTEERIVTVE